MIRLIVVILIFLSLFENPFVSRGQCPEQILDIAKTHISGGDNANALSELDKLYSNSLHFKQSDSIANALKEAGTLCFSINHYLKALQFFRLGYQVADSFGDSRVKIACSGNMGVVFAVMNDNGTAVYYLEKAFNEAYAQGFMDLAHIYANNLVVALCDIGDVERARIYVDKNAALTKDSTPVTHFTLIKDK